MQIARSGFLGVIVFFVLSGYIMSYVYQDWFRRLDRGAYVRFLGLRFARVYPLHLLTLLIVAGLIAAGIKPLGPNDNLTTFNLNLLLLHAWGFTNQISWNEASWSISTEVFCYLLFPLMLWLLHRTRWKFVFVLGLTVTWWVCLYFYRTTLASIVDMSHAQFSYAVSLLGLAVTFLIGVCAFHLTRHLRSVRPWAINAVTIAAFGVLMYSAVAKADLMLSQIAAAFLIAGLSQDSGIIGAALSNTIGKFLGDISYALYLIHIPLIYLWSAILAATTDGVWFHMVPLPARIGVAIAVAALLHYGFERPSRELIRKAIQLAPKASRSIRWLAAVPSDRPNG